MSSSDVEPKVATRSRLKGPSKGRFETIFAEGRRVNGHLLRIACLPGSGLVGFATSRKLGGKPPRNRQRRRLRAAVQACDFLVERGMDYVVILGSSCGAATFERITEEVRDLLARANSRWADELESS